MICHGARNIALMSRSVLENETSRFFVREMAKTEASVRAFRVDISAPCCLQAALNEIRSEMPAIKGVIQAGMFLKVSWGRMYL